MTADAAAAAAAAAAILLPCCPHLQIPSGGVMPLLRRKFARSDDIFYVNFGLW